MAEREEVISGAELARLYGVDERTVRNWVEAGCPHRKRSRRTVYLLSEVIPWRRQRDKIEARGSEKPDIADEQARKLRADADLAELKVAERRRELVPAADVERMWERLCGILRSRVLSLRGRWAPRLLGLGSMGDATRVLDELTSDILDALRSGADDLEGDDDAPDDDGDDEPPSDAEAA